MRIIIIKSLALLLACQQLSLVALAQGSPDVYDLPTARAGETYRVNLEEVLRQKYGLELRLGSRVSDWRWSQLEGLPPGLSIRDDGTVEGTPISGKKNVYEFGARVVDANSPKAPSSVLRFTLRVEQQRIQLASTNAPNLVPVVSRINPPAGACKDIDQKITNIQSRRPRASSSGSASYVTWPTTTCDASKIRLPKLDLDSGVEVITIDARNGHTEGVRRFETRETVVGVLDNKNPFMAKYKYTSTRTSVSENAIASFLPLLGGIVAEVAKPPEPAKADTKAGTPPPPGTEKADRAFMALRERSLSECEESDEQLRVLNARMECTTEYAKEVGENLRALKNEVNALKVAYDAGKAKLQNADLPRPALYCNSNQFLDTIKADSYQPRVTEVADYLDELQGLAADFMAKINDLASRFPDCITGKEMMKVEAYSKELSASVKKNQEIVEQIKKILTGVNEARNTVVATLENPQSFVEVHKEQPFEGSAAVAIGVEITPLSKDTPAPKPIAVNFDVGQAPFFSISGGMVFSTLRKVEYQRVEGFVLDRQGNEVLENGQPKLGTVVGLKEGSRTRISPLVLLNGRLHSWRNSRVLNSVHASFGITAKNDNKGTDVEFLVGPSFGLLENNLFLTVGAYAGRQQKLEGNFFKGLAAPASLGELPIRKDYRWGLGISLSYRIPINNEKKK